MASFANRHDVEQHLPGLVADIDGAIVEIGVGYGNGLLALARGTSDRRLTGIDPYVTYTDRLGGQYGPDTREQMLANIANIASRVDLVYKDARLAAGDIWDIALLWIDISQTFDKLKEIFDLYTDKVRPGGIVAIAGLPYRKELGTAQLAAYAVASGEYDQILMEQNLVAVLRKRKKKVKRAAFYLVDGESYAQEASRHAKSVKAVLGMETHLFAVGGTGQHANIDRVHTLPARTSDYWYLDSTRYFNRIVNGELGGYDQLLYLDTDTWIAYDCNDMWRILDNYDLALGQAAGRDATPSAFDTPPGFTIMSIGVNLFNNSARTRQLFAEWLDLFERHMGVYGNYDEAALRDALWLNKDIRFYTLPPEYSLRVGFGCWLYGRARILHARLPDLPRVAEQINERTEMRMWRYGWLWYHEKV